MLLHRSHLRRSEAHRHRQRSRTRAHAHAHWSDIRRRLEGQVPPLQFGRIVVVVRGELVHPLWYWSDMYRLIIAIRIYLPGRKGLRRRRRRDICAVCEMRRRLTAF